MRNNYNQLDRLSWIRSYRGISQKELAKSCGLSQSTIAQVETGRKSPTLKTLNKICKALKIDIVLLFQNHVSTEDLK